MRSGGTKSHLLTSRNTRYLYYSKLLLLLLLLIAHVLLCLQLIQPVVVQYLFWITFSVVFVLFAVGFVQIVSIHAIGKGLERERGAEEINARE